MPPITAFTTDGDSVGVLQPPVGFGHTAYQTDFRSQGDTDISLITVLINYFLKKMSLSFCRLPQPTDVVSLHDRGSELSNHLHRRDPASTKIGITIGVTFLFLFICGVFCVIRRRKPKNKRKPAESRSGSDRNSRRSSSHITGHVFTYQESVTNTQKKKSSRSCSRSRSQPCGDTIRLSRIGPEIYLAPPDPAYAGPSQAPNAMDAPQDFVECNWDKPSKSKPRKDGKKSKR